MLVQTRFQINIHLLWSLCASVRFAGGGDSRAMKSSWDLASLSPK